MKKLIFKFWFFNIIICLILFVISIYLLFLPKNFNDLSFFESIIELLDIFLSLYLSLVYLIILLCSSFLIFLNFIPRIRKNKYFSFLTFSGTSIICFVYLIYVYIESRFDAIKLNSINFLFGYISIFLAFTIFEYVFFRKGLIKIGNVNTMSLS